MPKITIEKDTAIISEDDTFLGKFIAGCKGNVIIKSPFIKGGKLELKRVKDAKGRELK